MSTLTEKCLGGSAIGTATAVCDNCGQTYAIGEWPLCPHGADGRGSMTYGSAGAEVWDEHIAPEPSPDFRPPKGIEYHPEKGYLIRTHGDRKALMRLNKSEYRRKKRGMPGQEV